MLRANQDAKRVFDKAFRLVQRYSTDYTERQLVEVNELSPADAAKITSLAKQLKDLEFDFTSINRQETAY